MASMTASAESESVANAVARGTRGEGPGASTLLPVVGRRYHLHFPGFVYAFTSVAIVLGAVNGQNNLLFWIFGLAVSGLVVSGVISGMSLMGLTLERVAPEHAAVGEPMLIRYRLGNRNRLFPALGLTIEELDHTGFSSRKATWARLMPVPICAVGIVGARGRTEAEAVVTPTRRGVCEFNAVRVSTTFPFGLTRKSVTFAMPTRVLVRPRPTDEAASAIQPEARRGEESQRARTGHEEGEFFALREYVPGDSPRRMAWRASARLGRPLVREWSTQQARRVWIVIDPPAGDAGERVLSAAAGLAMRAAAQGMEIGLRREGGRVLAGTRSGARHVGVILDELAQIDLDAPAEGGAATGDSGHGTSVLITADSGRATAQGVVVVRPPDQSAAAKDGSAASGWLVRRLLGVFKPNRTGSARQEARAS